MLNTLRMFLTMEHNSISVMEKFSTLPNSCHQISKNKNGWVYIPGTRKNRILLVAHADTVFNINIKPTLIFDGINIFSKDKMGLGADDRAGCAILWLLRNSGHSLLILDGEEEGCRGSKKFIRDGGNKIIEEHNFVLGFDETGRRNFVTYHDNTKELVKFIENYYGYHGYLGNKSDIRVLCKNVPGVNISVGFYDAHTSEESINTILWLETFTLTEKLLSENSLPYFRKS